MILGYINFANKHEQTPRPPHVGDDALLSVTLRLDSLKTRGFAVPSHGKYALKVPIGAFGIPFPIYHPTAVGAAKIKRNKPLRQAPLMPLNLIIKLENAAATSSLPGGLRLFCSLFCLMTLASLRFADLRQVADVWASSAAIFGLSVNQKKRMATLSSGQPQKGGGGGGCPNRILVSPYYASGRNISRPNKAGLYFFTPLRPWAGPSIQIGPRPTVQHRPR